MITEANNFRKYQRVLKLQIQFLINPIHKHRKKILDILELEIKKLPMVEDDYFFFRA